MYSNDIIPPIVSRSKRLTLDVTDALALGLSKFPEHSSSDVPSLQILALAYAQAQEFAGDQWAPQELSKTSSRSIQIIEVQSEKHATPHLIGINSCDGLAPSQHYVNFSVSENSSIDPPSKAREVFVLDERPT